MLDPENKHIIITNNPLEIINITEIKEYLPFKNMLKKRINSFYSQNQDLVELIIYSIDSFISQILDFNQKELNKIRMTLKYKK